MVVRSLSARKLQQELHESVACIKVLTGTSQRRREVHRARPGVATANDRIQAHCLPVPATAVAIEQCMRPVIDDTCQRLAPWRHVAALGLRPERGTGGPRHPGRVARSEERRVGAESGRTRSFRWSPYLSKKKQK